MTDRKKLIVANWKMHKNVHDASLLLHKLAADVPTHHDVEVVLCPTMLTIQSLSLQINRRQFKLGAQNCYWRDEGAYTGEVSATQLRGVVDYVLIGHSERRHIFGETETDIRAKVQAAIRNHIKPILCVGETTQQRLDSETKHVIHDQLVSGLANVTSEEIEQIAIAYEPVWAIGTGKNASAEDAEQVANVIHKQVAALYGEDAAASLRILYGGSVNDDNTDQYLSVKRIDGLLVGGASLTPKVFAKIVALAHNKHNDNSSSE
ncbi:MAG: triose-phosphate isomerase [Candidatus Saccharimonadales bacterium]|jgi:triosephosphate isomerase